MATPKETKAAQTSTSPKAVASGAAADKMAAVRAARNSNSDNDKFTFKAELTKGAPQAKEIVKILQEAGTKGITRKELIAKMEGRVITRQPQSRILSYYQPDLVSAGAITVDKAAPTPVAATSKGHAPMAAAVATK